MTRIISRWTAAAVCALVLGFGLSRPAVAQQSMQSIDPDYSGEVLASALYRHGTGRIEIRRAREDDVDGVAMVRTGLVSEYASRPALFSADLSLADRVGAMYRDLTGQEMTLAAYRALREVEAQKAAGAMTDSAAGSLNGSGNEGFSPRAGCSNISIRPEDYFYLDCYGYGLRKVEAGGTDDVCLMVAAIKGNVGMQISYKAINGTFYDSFHSDVAQGHYIAAALWTGTKRTRKGQIYGASVSEYSRFVFSGDYRLLGVIYPQEQRGCLDLL